MADEKSYLSYTGLVKLVEQIKSLVTKAATDASTAAYESADASLKAHAEKKDGEGFIHVSAADRKKWDDAATTAANAVSNTLFNTSIEALKNEDASITTALGKTDASLKLTDGSLDNHIKNGTVHITAAERTKWDKVVTDFTNHDSSADIHVTAADKKNWIEWHDSSNNYYKKTETYSQSEVDSKISAAAAAVFTFKGTVDTSAALPEVSTANVGDVWHVNDGQGNEYVCVKDSSTSAKRWEVLGHTVDLSSYATKDYVNNKVSSINTDISTLKSDVSTLKTTVKNLNDASTSYAKATDLTALTTRVSTAETNIKDVSTKLDNFIDSSAGGYATKTYVDGKFTDAKQTFAGTAANATLAADASKLGNKDASEYALKSELAEQMVEAIPDASITALFPENAKA